MGEDEPRTCIPGFKSGFPASECLHAIVGLPHRVIYGYESVITCVFRKCERQAQRVSEGANRC